jgi:hypothetical protein
MAKTVDQTYTISVTIPNEEPHTLADCYVGLGKAIKAAYPTAKIKLVGWEAGLELEGGE